MTLRILYRSSSQADLVGPPAGLRILDVACGHGRISRELARRGAGVVGADISAALIGKAVQAERDHPHGLRYVHADVTSPGWHAILESAAFDVVTCNFGLSDIDDLDGALAAVSAVLRPGGCFVFSILHPCFPGAPRRLRFLAARGPLLRRGPLDRRHGTVAAAPPGRRPAPHAVHVPQRVPQARAVARRAARARTCVAMGRPGRG